MLRILGLTPKETPSSSPEEIELIIKQGAADGVIEPVEQELISAIFNYADRRLWDVMTPRTSMVALEADLSPAEALQIAQEHGFSRFPVYEGNLDNILGYVHVKDIIWADQSSNLRQAIREIVHIPGGMPLPAAFSTLTRAGKHMAIVLDEYGGTDGLLTLEDLLEVIVGEIEDEHSPLAYQPKVRPGEWVFNGATPIAEIEEILDVDFKSQGVYVTLAGFILNELGAIPAVGASIEKHGYRFTVQEMVNLRISAVLVQVTN
jgi:putative hemolysin